MGGQSSGTGQKQEGLFATILADLENLFGSRIEWLLAHPFHSSPGAQTTLVHLCFSPSHTLRILRAVVPSRSDLALAGI